MRSRMFSIVVYDGDQLIYKQMDMDPYKAFHRIAVFMGLKYFGIKKKEVN